MPCFTIVIKKVSVLLVMIEMYFQNVSFLYDKNILLERVEGFDRY